MTTIDIVAGARPNFMKVAPILAAIERLGLPLEVSLTHTGQHYDAVMSDVFFEQLRMRAPDTHLGVGSGSHGAQTGKLIAAYEEHLVRSRPRGVVVVGDVNSTMACALAAVKLRIPVAHVEAGLRSFDRDMPEEINRIVTDAVSDLHFVSEESGVKNLLREGISEKCIHLVGNVMIDTLVSQLAASADEAAGANPVGDYGYVTLHRPSNVDEPGRLREVVDVLSRVAERLPLVFSIHPRTSSRLAEFGLEARLQAASRIRVTGPLGYRESLALLRSSRVVITDSGGIQEESTYLGVPCLTLRPNTERPVTVEVGTSTLVGDDIAAVPGLVQAIMSGTYKVGGPVPLWDGRAAERIGRVLAGTWQ